MIPNIQIQQRFDGETTAEHGKLIFDVSLSRDFNNMTQRSWGWLRNTDRYPEQKEATRLMNVIEPALLIDVKPVKGFNVGKVRVAYVLNDAVNDIKLAYSSIRPIQEGYEINIDMLEDEGDLPVIAKDQHGNKIRGIAIIVDYVPAEPEPVDPAWEPILEV